MATVGAMACGCRAELLDGGGGQLVMCSLHAAAPRMLKVLKNFSAFTYSELAHEPGIWAEFLTDATAAIKQARGES